MLRRTEEFKDSPVVRTRDMKVLETLDCCVDVGAVYDPSTHRYDHHQRTFDSTLDADHKIKLSSAGIVYKHFGHEVTAATEPGLITWNHPGQVLSSFCGLARDDPKLEASARLRHRCCH